jgi:hypothetical protein
MMLLASTSWWPGILQTVIGAVIGAAGAIGGGAFASWFTWQKERQSVASALAGEVQGFIDVVDSRQIRELIPKGYVFPIDDHPFPVFEANVGKIGALPPDLAAEVASFYSHARGTVQDLRTVRNQTAMLNAGEFNERVVGGINILKTKAEALVPKLRKEAARSWQDYLQPT